MGERELRDIGGWKFMLVVGLPKKLDSPEAISLVVSLNFVGGYQIGSLFLGIKNEGNFL